MAAPPGWTRAAGEALKAPVRLALRTLPPWAPIDRAIAAATFLFDHHRLPRDPETRYADLLYRIKTRCLDDPLRVLVSDKVAAKAHIRAALGWDPCPETYAVFRRPDEISAAALRVPCVVKPTHMSGRAILLTAPPTPDELVQMRRWLGLSYYYRHSRERNYRTLRPGVISEEMANTPARIADHKIHCLDGEPAAVRVLYDRWVGGKRAAIFSPDWTLLEDHGDPPPDWIAARPPELSEMLEVARRLSAPFDYIRVDFFLGKGRFFVGELTSLPYGARRSRPAGEAAVMDRILARRAAARGWSGRA